jgi:hypothetical protein
MGPLVPHRFVDPFDVDRFLARPLVARVASEGPTIRPIWYLWEGDAFWWITGPYAASLLHAIEMNARLAIVVDSCDLRTGEVLKVTAEGVAETRPFVRELAKRLLTRYLGPHVEGWDGRFRSTLFEESGETLIRLEPESLRARDLSFSVGSEPDEERGLASS